MPATVHTLASHEAVLKAAKRLFARRGLQVVTMLDIAEAAKVSRATVFNQFGSKAAVLDAIAAEVLGGYVALLDTALTQRTADTARLLVEIGARMGHGIAAESDFYRAFFTDIAKVSLGPDEGGEAQQVRRAAFERLVRLFLRAQARGDLTRAEEAEDLAEVFDSLVFGTIAHWLNHGPAKADLPERMRRAVGLFLNGALREAGARERKELTR